MLRLLACMILIAATVDRSDADDRGSDGACCGHVTHFATGLEPLRFVHVSVDGSDGSGDGSAELPFRTLSHAASQAVAGDSIVLSDGVHDGGTFLYDLAGTPGAPIWIGGQPSERGTRPVIEGGSEGLHLIRCKYIVLHDIEVRNAANNGINCDDGSEYDNADATHHLLFENLFIHDIGGGGNQDGLKLSGVNDFVVINCRFERCGGGGSGSGIDHVGCHHGLIVGCRFNEMSGNAIQCKGGSHDLEIRWCRITDAGQRGINIGGSTGFQFFRPPLSESEPNVEAHDIRVLGNIFEGSTTPFAFVGSTDCIAANNTIITPTRWLFRILQETTSSGEFEFLPCADNRFENNLVYFDRGELSTYVNIGPNTDAKSFSFTSNLWYAYDNPGQSAPALPVDESGGVYGVDPEIADPEGGNYDIAGSSAAGGAAQVNALLGGDYHGRCFANPPSIGAFEANPVTADVNGDGLVNVGDLLLVINNWGEVLVGRRRGDLTGDANGDGVVNVGDLLLVINNWGASCDES